MFSEDAKRDEPEPRRSIARVGASVKNNEDGGRLELDRVLRQPCLR